MALQKLNLTVTKPTVQDFNAQVSKFNDMDKQLYLMLKSDLDYVSDRIDVVNQYIEYLNKDIEEVNRLSDVCNLYYNFISSLNNENESNSREVKVVSPSFFGTQTHYHTIFMYPKSGLKRRQYNTEIDIRYNFLAQVLRVKQFMMSYVLNPLSFPENTDLTWSPSVGYFSNSYGSSISLHSDDLIKYSIWLKRGVGNYKKYDRIVSNISYSNANELIKYWDAYKAFSHPEWGEVTADDVEIVSNSLWFLYSSIGAADNPANLGLS